MAGHFSHHLRRLLNAFVRYRRAGIAFTRGENTVEVTEEQLAIIRADSVLSVVSTTAAETLAEAGGLDVLGVGDLNTRIPPATVAGLDKRTVGALYRKGAKIKPSKLRHRWGTGEQCANQSGAG
ncbi:HI1506-related protein [Escherichia coli]